MMLLIRLAILSTPAHHRRMLFISIVNGWQLSTNRSKYLTVSSFQRYVSIYKRPQAYHRKRFRFLPLFISRFSHRRPVLSFYLLICLVMFIMFAPVFQVWFVRFYRRWVLGVSKEQLRLEAKQMEAEGWQRYSYGANMKLPFTFKTFDMEPKIGANHKWLLCEGELYRALGKEPTEEMLQVMAGRRSRQVIDKTAWYNRIWIKYFLKEEVEEEDTDGGDTDSSINNSAQQ